jgi:hypothetical protein
MYRLCLGFKDADGEQQQGKPEVFSAHEIRFWI